MHSFISCLVHCVWSTKNRAPLLDLNLQERLWPYLAGIAKQNRMRTLAVGGVADHIHTVISLPATLSVAEAIQLLKGNFSRWINDAFPDRPRFSWQEGYGAFSIGVSGVEATKNYILKQPEHHRRRTFREELRAMLRKHGLKFDEHMLD